MESACSADVVQGVRDNAGLSCERNRAGAERDGPGYSDGNQAAEGAEDGEGEKSGDRAYTVGGDEGMIMIIAPPNTILVRAQQKIPLLFFKNLLCCN